VDRFRANFVIEGLDPLAENELKSLKISEACFEVQGPCTRCQMICIDQKSGEKTTEPLRTIGKVFKGKMRFGIYLKHLNCNEIVVKCGDEILF
jgi:molybdenum cofactor sulfurtransferase